MADPFKSAWDVFWDFRDVFSAVLKASGPWSGGEDQDVTHDFLIDQLPHALASFDPTRGEIKPWLYRVFRNFVVRWRRREAGATGFLVAVQDLQDRVPSPVEPGPSPDSDRAVADALHKLPADLRSFLLALYGQEQEVRSMRGLARQFRMSRGRFSRTFGKAVDALATLLSEAGVLSRDEVNVCHEFAACGGDPTMLSSERGAGAPEVRERLTAVLSIMLGSLARLHSSGKEVPNDR